MGRVDHQPDAIATGHAHQLVQAASISAVVQRHDDSCAWRHPSLHIVDVDIQCIRVHFAKNGPRADRQGDLRRRDEGERRHDDFSLSRQIQGRECHVQCSRARADGDHVLDL